MSFGITSRFWVSDTLTNPYFWFDFLLSLVLLLLLPALVELLLLRSTLRLTSTVATMLACDGEAKLLGDMASLYGYLAAAVSVCSVTFVLALGLLIHCGVAV